MLCIALAGGIIYTIVYMTVQQQIKKHHQPSQTIANRGSDQQAHLHVYIYIIIGALFCGLLLWLLTWRIRGIATRNVNSLLFSPR